MINYLKDIGKFDIISKEGLRVPFILNAEQKKLLAELTGRDIILKARQIGFSSLILAIFTVDFLLVENSRSVCLSSDGEASQKLFDRVKFFIRSAEDKGLALTLKYNSRNEMLNSTKNSSFYIGRAGSKSFGRGATLTNLHMSEFAYYPDPEAMMASVTQAVVPNGRVIIETTAAGMGFFKTFWDRSQKGETGFKCHFFDRSHYSQEFLDQRKKELGDDLFCQEYPATDLEAFISSGNPFFDQEALKHYLANTIEPINTYQTFYDLAI